MNKIQELQVASEIYNAKIIIGNETKLTSEISNAEIHLRDFQVFRKDRNNGKCGGGSCIYVHNTIKAESLANFSAPDSLGISVNINNKTTKILCIYRSQNLNEIERLELLNSIKNFKQDPNEELQIYGDFNLPNVKWDSGFVNCPRNTVDRFFTVQIEFLEALLEKGLTSLISDGTVTRRRMVDGVLQESLLDQILVSNYNVVENVETLSPFGKSDHIPILVTYKIKNNVSYIKTEKQIWSKFSSDQILQLGNGINWEYSSEELSSNQMWEELSGKLSSISGHVPKRKLKCSKNGDIVSKPPWDNSALKRKRKQKDLAWRNFDNNPTPENLNIASQKQTDFETQERKAVLSHENKVVSCIKTNPKIFYSYMNSKRKIKESVSVLKDKNNQFSNSPRETANLLADFFSSTFVEEPFGPLNQECYDSPNNCISDLNISSDKVKKLLSKVNPSKSSGPDNIHPKLLRSLSENDSFVDAITLLFSKCYQTSLMPLQWKTANIVALHKKGCKSSASNYRPVSLTCILCKIYESIVREHIFNHVKEFITRKQHGFMPGRSCFSNLLESLDIISDMLAKGEDVDIFYLDFQKAFDTVPHYRLYLKLFSFGVQGKVLDTVFDFLSNRTCNVVVGDSRSNSFNVTSGVPQGSVLGPLLFLLYINDLPENIKNTVFLFADDLKMVSKANKLQLNQTDLNTLVLWQNKWLVKFNTRDNKCKVMHIGKSNPHNKYNLGGVELPSVESEKDLGVLVTSNLDFSDHITSCINKANSCVAWVARSLVSRDSEIMLKIYKSMIRPHIEYCVQLWSPLPSHGNWGVILALENVQRKFTRMINNIGLLPYKDRLKSLGLTTLLERRSRGDLIETFKIVHGFSDYGPNLFNISRSGVNLISKPGDQHKMRHSFFTRRVINFWNKLPSYVKLSKSVDIFKNNLSKFKRLNFHENGHFWELSNEIFSRIDSDRTEYVSFVRNNPNFARSRNINTRVTMG